MKEKWIVEGEKISREAGELLLRGFRSPEMTVSYKSRTNLVTNMDRLSEDLITRRLEETFPEHSIIAEEGSEKLVNGEYLWYVDPLDATNNYAHGIAYFCISLGLFSRIEKCIVAGIIYDPWQGELFSALRGAGTLLNGKPVKVSSIPDIGISIVSTGFPYVKDDPARNNIEQINRVAPHVQDIRRMGSAALDLCGVACGRFDGYWEPELHPWDMAAGSLIVEEAGEKVTGYSGKPFDVTIPRIVASNGLIHEKLSRLIGT